MRSCWAIIAFLGWVAVALSAKELKPNAFKGVRIVKGRNTVRGKAGYVVYIRNKKQLENIDIGFVCAGTIVSQRHVVSAAHCFRSLEPDMLTVVIGQVDRNPIIPEGKSLKRRGVEYIFQHPDYEATTFHADVAVLKLKSNIGFGAYSAKADLCREPLQAGDELMVYGWGRSSADDTQYSNLLKEVAVPVLAMDECKRIYKGDDEDDDGEITDLMFCAGLRDGKDACQGDSGGPAIRKGALCGVVSWGSGCGDAVTPGVYTNITAVRDFIEECLRK